MRIEELIERLQSLAAAAPGAVVLIGRGADNWYDEVEDLGLCTINRDHDGLDCVPPRTATGGNEEVIVIH